MTVVSGPSKPRLLERRVARATAPQRCRRGRGWLHRAERPPRGARGAGGGREGPRDTWALLRLGERRELVALARAAGVEGA